MSVKVVKLERLYNWAVANISGFGVMKLIPAQYLIKFIIGLISAFTFTVVSDMAHVWLKKRKFFKKYEKDETVSNGSDNKTEGPEGS